MVKDSYWALLDQYGWQIRTNSYHGPNEWADDGFEYNSALMPFYLMKAGTIPTGIIGNNPHQNYLSESGFNGGMWSGAPANGGSGFTGGALDYGIANNLALIAATSIGQHRAHALRCLTQ